MTRTYTELLRLVDAAETVQPPGPAPAALGTEPTAGPGAGAGADQAALNEAPDDPHRLARVNLACYASRHGGRTLRFWRDEWYVWKRNRYQKISAGELRAKITAAVKCEFDRLYRQELAAAEASSRDGQEPPVVRKVTMPIVSATLQSTTGMTCIPGACEFGTWLPDRTERAYVAMENGILDLDAMMADHDDVLLPHAADWFSTVCLPYRFEPGAPCRKWLAFLDYNLESDTERIHVLQEWFGLCLTKDTSFQRFLAMEGEGANGKSVAMAALTAMLGRENVSSVSLEEFGERFALTGTIGKLLNTAGDCSEIDKAAEGRLKSYTSGDRMFFDRKGLPGVHCSPTARLMFNFNTRPRFADRSDGLWRRMLLMPWRVKVPPERRLLGMDNACWWEGSGELPGILCWAVRGLVRLRAQCAFTPSRVMQEATEEYQEEMNPARAFLLDRCRQDAHAITVCSELYEAYCDWCKKTGHSHPLSDRQFGKEVRRRFSGTKRERETTGDRQWYYTDLAVGEPL